MPGPLVPGVVLAAGLLLGILGDVLFHGAGPGVNAALWAGPVLGTGWWMRRHTGPQSSVLPWLLGLMLFFAACLAWRASPFLRFWNGAAVLAGAVAVTASLRGGIAGAWVSGYLRAAADLAGRLAGGALAAAAQCRWPGADTPAVSARWRAGAVGAALALPVVFVFGALLVSADPVVEGFVVTVFSWDLSVAAEHVVLTIALSWIALGWLRSSTARRKPTENTPLGPPRVFGLIEIAVPLGALTVLLAAFIGVQARYLFGGNGFVQSAGLSYAEFARRGFFELVALSILVVPLLYLAAWVLDRNSPRAAERFRALVLVLVLLVGLVMVSAVARMQLYVAAYGLTEDRLYAEAFMLWIGWVLAWFVTTEWRAQPARFATGSVLAGFAVLAALNLVNPDAIIVRTNVALVESGREFDAEYVGRLSADAIPRVAAAWDDLDAAARCVLQAHLVGRIRPAGDWREWSWAGWRARRAVESFSEDSTCNE